MEVGLVGQPSFAQGEGTSPEATGSPSFWRRHWRWVTAAAAWTVLAVLLAVYVVWPLAASDLQVEDLGPGDEVTLRSGLRFVVPDGADGSFSHWRRLMDEAGGALEPADDVLISLGPSSSDRSVGISALWVAEPGEETVIDMLRRQQPVVASSDGSVEVRWSGARENAYVFVVTRLPGRLPGYVSIDGSTATTPKEAWQEAADVWQRLSISGVELPPAPAP